MSIANRKAAIDWLNGHRGREIVIQAQGSTLKVVGRADGVESIDACGTRIYECELLTGMPGIQVAMSLHEDTLALHLLGNRSEDGGVVCSLPVSVPYDQVRFSIA